MEDVFWHHVIDYVTPDIFMKSNLSLLCKNEKIQILRKRLNVIHSANLLNKRFWTQKMRNIMHIFLDDYLMFLKFIIEILLKEYDIDFVSDTDTQLKNKIFKDKYVCSNTVYTFDKEHKIKTIDFEVSQQIVYNQYICSTYRLCDVQKQILLDNCPYAKALIY